MKNNFENHLVNEHTLLKDCLNKLNKLGSNAIIFILDSNNKLIGSLTDGDIRRGILNGYNYNDPLINFFNPNPKKIKNNEYDIFEIIEFKKDNLKLIPVVDKNDNIINIINISALKSYLPVDVVIMAGGKGKRLSPLTDSIPKPLLKVGNKTILDHNIDRLTTFGIDDIWISIGHLGNLIKEKIGNGNTKNININYINEDKPMGTIGSLSKKNIFKNDYVMVLNSDILTNIDFEQFFLNFINSDVDFSIASLPYTLNIPYAILEKKGDLIKNITEKPSFTYYANAGIYLMKKEVINKIPRNNFFDATDLIDLLIKNNYKVNSFPIRGYWLDIGNKDDYLKAQEDINFIKF